MSTFGKAHQSSSFGSGFFFLFARPLFGKLAAARSAEKLAVPFVAERPPSPARRQKVNFVFCVTPRNFMILQDTVLYYKTHLAGKNAGLRRGLALPPYPSLGNGIFKDYFAKNKKASEKGGLKRLTKYVK